jgi:CheY-like chemotaxis protein
MDCDGALSGAAAVRVIKGALPRYDVVFMDHMMPEMDGIEATARIRALDGMYAKEVPIIALTANTMAESEKMFLDAGMNAYLAKPLDIEKLDREMARLGRCRAPAPGQDGDAEDCAEFDHIAIEGMDFADGLRRFTNAGMYKNILKSFVRNTPPVVEKIRQIMSGGYPPGSDYSILVHGIKGSARAIGGVLAGELAEELERAAKGGDAALVARKTPELLARTETLIAGLNGVLFAGEDAEAGKEARERPPPELLARISRACESYDMVEIDDVLRELEKYRYTADDGIVAYIREQIDNCEYQAAAEKINSFLKAAASV